MSQDMLFDDAPAVRYVEQEGETYAVKGKAVFGGEDNEYRYLLWRKWNYRRARMYVVMLNPSTADADVDDPTVRRLMFFAVKWGFGMLTIANQYAFRSSDPGILRRTKKFIGPENDRYLRNVAHMARDRRSELYVAWGAVPEAINRAAVVSKILDGPKYCFGLTKDGHPKHPMARGIHRIPDDVDPDHWFAPGELS